MDAELSQLEARVATLIEEHGQLRADKRVLLERIAALEAENRQLADKVQHAIRKVEEVLASLPESEDA
ncbi:MAG: hypothetical protein REI94_02085 [Moraxellaceae bacterium]|nr:hypothetical protein [Moraxellaceae bacterium]